MGTYAEWRLWVGLSNDALDTIKLSETARDFINEVMESLDPIERNGIQIQSIAMHGETIGFGVVIGELSWEVEIGERNVLDPTMIETARQTESALNFVFDEVGIPLRAVIYHHLDLDLG